MHKADYATQKWFKLLSESEDPNYIQKSYEVEVDVRISKSKGGNKEQTVNDIRAIERVTTVTDPARAGLTRHSRDTPEYHFNRYVIKFELNSDLNPRYWVRRYLVKDLTKIEGLSIVRWAEPRMVA